MPDRSHLPEISQITSIREPKAEMVTLDNGIRLGVVKDDTLNLIRLDMAFRGGKWKENKKLACKAACCMLDKGTRTKTAQQIADTLDFYGSAVSSQSANHFSFFSAFSLSKYLPQTYDMAVELLKEASFPQSEFKILKSKLLTSYKIRSKKVSNMAVVAMNKAIFGETHPYGASETEDDFEALTCDDSKVFYDKVFHSSGCVMMVCGNVNDGIISEINRHFGGNDWEGGITSADAWIKPERTTKKRIFVEKSDALQNSLNFSGPLLPSYGEDYAKLKVLISLLGGYFGSRLMKSIREDKGYTYGIHAGLKTYPEACYINIKTDADYKYTDAIIDEVFHQMEILKTELVGDDELGMLKNYLLGTTLAQFDSSFSIADYCFESMISRPEDRSQKFIEAVRTISRQDILELANKYFVADDFITVVAGRKN